MSWSVVRVAALLFGSGMCALVYQVAWLRALRLIFGASTEASAAVLAIFMGGLGLGGALLGRRVDRHPNPLRFYAHLELAIAGAAALTPFLISLARSLYIGLGGATALGPVPATLARLFLATAVLAVPTVLMGGTLPAAARAVETESDTGRRHLALLYGANTLGAVAGAFLCTFWLLALFGIRGSLWMGCLCNLLVGISARSLARAAEKPAQESAPPAEGSPAAVPDQAGGVPPLYILAAAAATGFAFLLMELVWYRMLGPVLGGSTYTFGLILCVVLLGIGMGGLAYAKLARPGSPTLALLGLSLGAEALCVALPYALGDRLAILAAQLRALGAFGFAGDAAGWAVVSCLAIFPAAFVSGMQFPLLLGLLGRGRRDVGRHTGLAYAWNTAGSIAGSLAGGFGILPLLTAPGTWRGVVLLLAAFAAAALALSARRERRARGVAPGVAVALAAALIPFVSTGPTAAWRHSPIGAGRVDLFQATPNGVRQWANGRRREIAWEAEGVESSVAISRADGLGFIVNGKADGNALGDADTQVMLGLVGAALHPNPRRSLVVGLGTGSSAGWLADVPEMERVDVVELEPAILEVARRCAPVNRNVLSHPKVRVTIGDAREVLLTTRQRYDVIASEPSNPYRAGVATLYTREFYQGVAARLAKGGLFLQWVQAYEVDALTMRVIYATLASVFPVVQTWQTNPRDLLLVCSLDPLVCRVPFLRERVAREPFRSAMAGTWRTVDLEGFLSHFVAGGAFARAAAAPGDDALNTDDRMRVEYAFAGTVGRLQAFSIEDLRVVARTQGDHRPPVAGGPVDWRRVEQERLLAYSLEEYDIPPADQFAPEVRPAVDAIRAFRAKDWGAVTAASAQGVLPLRSPQEQMVAAVAAVETGAPQAAFLVARLRAERPTEAAILVAELMARQGRTADAAGLLADAFARCRVDPWAVPLVVRRAFRLAPALAARDPAHAPRLYAALARPFCLWMQEEERRRTVLAVAACLDAGRFARSLEVFEPHVPWETEFLILRARGYRAAEHPLAARAERDLMAFLRGDSVKLSDLLIHDPSLPGTDAPAELRRRPFRSPSR